MEKIGVSGTANQFVILRVHEKDYQSLISMAGALANDKMGNEAGWERMFQFIEALSGIVRRRVDSKVIAEETMRLIDRITV